MNTLSTPIARWSLSYALVGGTLCLAATANAQTTAAARPEAPSPSMTNEEYELVIASKRIVESPFRRSAHVTLSDGARTGVMLGVGFRVVAQRATITLRGITGSVKLRASLAPIERILERRQSPSASPVAP